MAKSNFSQIISHYEKDFQLYGYSPKALGWNKGKQFLRFKQLTEDFKLEGKSFLDVGCGFGDFNKYLSSLSIENYNYTGIDLVESFIDQAKIQNHSDNARYIQDNFLDHKFNSDYDIVFASGTFNIAQENHDGYNIIEKSMEKMFSLCKESVCIDFLTDKVDYKHEHNFNSAPDKILSMAYKLSRRVILKNNYFPFEFAVIIYKDDHYCRDTSLFEEIKKSYQELI
jgi:SAM-dependent methyltransferase